MEDTGDEREHPYPVCINKLSYTPAFPEVLAPGGAEIGHDSAELVQLDNEFYLLINAL
jgi:hypothetical protein